MTQREQVHLFGGHVAETAEEQQQCTDFETCFWKPYPKKVGKLAAIREWAKLKPSPVVCQQITAALAWQVQQPAWTQDGGQWIPDPRKWLHHGRWMDEKPAPKHSGPWWDACQHSPRCTALVHHQLKVFKEQAQ